MRGQYIVKTNLRRMRSSRVRKSPNSEGKNVTELSKARFRDYTHGEWATIDTCIVKALKSRKGLSKSERLQLLAAGRSYWKDMIDRARGNYIPPHKRIAFWRKVARDFFRICRRMESASELYGDKWRSIGIVWLPDDLSNKICSRLLAPDFHPEMFFSGVDQTLRIGDIFDLLLELQKQSSGLAQAGVEIVGNDEPFVIFDQTTGRMYPSVIYFKRVLQLWGEFGGALRLPTRNWNTNKLDNGLLRFFRAVVDPVMGKYAPSSESIPDIIKRQRLKYRREPWLDPLQG
jgi:hypothetical protein